jgi:hypothetical protein
MKYLGTPMFLELFAFLAYLGGAAETMRRGFGFWPSVLWPYAFGAELAGQIGGF